MITNTCILVLIVSRGYPNNVPIEGIIISTTIMITMTALVEVVVEVVVASYQSNSSIYQSISSIYLFIYLLIDSHNSPRTPALRPAIAYLYCLI